jgi:hypothetical protein
VCACARPTSWNASTGNCDDAPAACIFPNTDSCLRLISALLAEFDDEWMIGKVYLNLNP